MKEEEIERDTFKEMAEKLRSDLKLELEDAPFIKEEFMKLCVWML